MSIKNTIWVEKYRPQKLEDMILPDRVITKVKNGIQNHMLLHGSAGLGKTSLARIIAKDKSSMYINCSVETGVDTVRTKITDFCTNIALSFDGSGERQEKIVILDEFDGASDAYFKAMRGAMEQFSATTKFIATCNYFQKIPSHMQSRFDCIDFNFSKEDEKDLIKKYIVRIHEIAKAEGISIEPKAILRIVKEYFPDLRSTITFLQSMYSEGKTKIVEADLDKFSGEFKELFQMFFDKKFSYFQIYSYIYKNYLGNEDNVFVSLGKDLGSYIQKEQSDKIMLLGPITTLQADWSYKSQFVADKMSTLAALVFNIHKLTNS